VSRLIVVAVYVAVVAALVAVLQLTSSHALGALALVGFLGGSAAFAVAFLRFAPSRSSNRLARDAERLAEQAEREHYALMGGEPVFVFAVDDVDVFPSVGDAAASFEGIDVAQGEIEASFTLDGRIVQAGSRGEVTVLTVTEDRDVAELERRLRSFAGSAGLVSSPDDPRAVANEMLRRRWERRWPKRPRWLDERMHGSSPHQF
jgi:hypothetical protein